ncbi:transketolase C-terminal domain-containing protein [Lentisphaerota bacterium ZTH]|nr:transketolase [Lentisphaerota bacterium]WET05148.1 transketolase C-terminal domain-containing protein [Lentisphaerota bacterium ZTH]
MNNNIKPMRDVFLAGLIEKMEHDPKVFFLAADFGAPTLDILREKFPDRFLNVGIAEQNLINVAAGLALEGFKVCAYAIAPFITMRCYEQVKVNLALMSQVKEMNVTLIGVGAGFSYVVSGPTHHSVEDISIMRTLPNVEVLSPADWVAAGSYVDFIVDNPGIKYLRFDSQPTPAVYPEATEFADKGYNVLSNGSKACIVSTGYMTQEALEAAEKLQAAGIDISVIDIFKLKNPDFKSLADELANYEYVISMEEGFIRKGGLDSLLLNLINDHKLNFRFEAVGLDDNYKFELGNRRQLLANYKAESENVVDRIKEHFSE